MSSSVLLSPVGAHGALHVWDRDTLEYVHGLERGQRQLQHAVLGEGVLLFAAVLAWRRERRERERALTRQAESLNDIASDLHTAHMNVITTLSQQHKSIWEAQKKDLVDLDDKRKREAKENKVSGRFARLATKLLRQDMKRRHRVTVLKYGEKIEKLKAAAFERDAQLRNKILVGSLKDVRERTKAQIGESVEMRLLDLPRPAAGRSREGPLLLEEDLNAGNIDWSRMHLRGE